MKEHFIDRAANRQAHQILRADREARTPLDHHLEGILFAFAQKKIRQCQAVLVSDYAKGVCDPKVLRYTSSTWSGKPTCRS
jgi:D-beta-D-heptose 7-phosphate kinase/D-beta-D-heptose 1-phosphate adenosyltransferase